MVSYQQNKLHSTAFITGHYDSNRNAYRKVYLGAKKLDLF